MIFDVDDISEIEEGYEIKLENKDKEIEILQSKNKKIQTILRTRARQDRKRKAKLRKLRLETTSQRLKLERLNNIINGLEKTISLDFNYVNNDLSDNFVLGIRNEAKSIYRELQELKGSDKYE